MGLKMTSVSIPHNNSRRAENAKELQHDFAE